MVLFTTELLLLPLLLLLVLLLPYEQNWFYQIRHLVNSLNEQNNLALQVFSNAMANQLKLVPRKQINRIVLTGYLIRSCEKRDLLDNESLINCK